MKIGVMGYGLMGRLHAGILKTIPGVDLVGVVEIASERKDQGSRELRVPFFDTLDEIVARIDALVVTLPDAHHVEACVTALRAGKFVLVEKPLATTLADARTILDAQVEPDRLMVAHLLRFDLRIQELKRRIERGELGRIEFFKIHRSNTRTSAARLGGRVSVVAFLGVHDLDLLLWLTGERIRDVAAIGARVMTGNWDVTLAHLVMESGAVASVENHWLIHGQSARSCIAGIDVFGSKGTARLDLSTDELQLVTDGDTLTRYVDTRNWTHDGGVSGGSLRREIEAFVRAAQSGSPMPVTGEEALMAVDALNRIEAALPTG